MYKDKDIERFLFKKHTKHFPSLARVKSHPGTSDQKMVDVLVWGLGSCKAHVTSFPVPLSEPSEGKTPLNKQELNTLRSNKVTDTL